MKHFSYSFAVSMLHSLWQMAVLVLFYYVLTIFIKRNHPAVKKNILYSLLFVQLITSVFTFIFYYTHLSTFLQDIIYAVLNNVVVNQEWLKQNAVYFFYGYALIALYKSISLFIQSLNFKNSYKKHLVKPPVDVKLFAYTKAHQFGIKRKIAVWYSNTIFTPLTFGFFKPIILIPVALMNNLSMAETEALIIHELSHIKQNDYLLNWFLLSMETTFFFNPFIKIITQKIKLEREKSCDSQVIQFDYPAVLYAEVLLKTVQQKKELKRFQLGAVFNNSQLFKRIHFFSNEDKLDFRKKSNSFVSSVCLCLVLLLNIFLMQSLQNINNIFSIALPQKAIVKKTSVSVTTEISSTLETTPVEEPNKNDQATVISNNTIVEPQKALAVKQEKNKDKIARIEIENNLNGYYITPASVKLQEPVQTKEVLVNEESSSGKIITQAYQVQFKDGKWVAKPLWMTTDIKASGKDRLGQNQMGDTLYNITSVQ